ncbi:hypothetical protein AA105894_2543 [Asaia spathodeae NBRC 105894]|nr:hypothetical protein AA105894_2543 [Asaia spathodeae NBRC 105894]
MSKETPNPADGNGVTRRGPVRWNSSENQGNSGCIFDPLSGWRSDDCCRAVHEALASITFRRLYETFEQRTYATGLPPADTL